MYFQAVGLLRDVLGTHPCATQTLPYQWGRLPSLARSSMRWNGGEPGDPGAPRCCLQTPGLALFCLESVKLKH